MDTVTARQSVSRTKAAQAVSGRRFRIKRDWMIAAILGVLGLLTFVPLLMLLQLSFKNEQQMADAMWLPAWPLQVSNYVKVYRVVGPYMLNSAVFVLGTVTVSTLCSVLTAYALARYPFPGREFFYITILVLLMIPGILTLIPTFVVTIKLKLNNTFPGIWLPLASGAQAFQIIVLRTFFASVPEELFEAGRLDGASESRLLAAIALPLAKPILTTLVVLQCNGVWNEYIWPIMVLSRPEQYPAMLGILQLRNLMMGQHDPGAEYAGYVLVGLPLLILFSLSSRAFVRGVTSGAIKM